MSDAAESEIGSDPQDPCSPANFNGDDRIGLADVLMMVGEFANARDDMDLNRSGVVDLADLLIEVRLLGLSCG